MIVMMNVIIIISIIVIIINNMIITIIITNSSRAIATTTTTTTTTTSIMIASMINCLKLLQLRYRPPGAAEEGRWPCTARVHAVVRAERDAAAPLEGAGAL